MSQVLCFCGHLRMPRGLLSAGGLVWQRPKRSGNQITPLLCNDANLTPRCLRRGLWLGRIYYPCAAIPVIDMMKRSGYWWSGGLWLGRPRRERWMRRRKQPLRKLLNAGEASLASAAIGWLPDKEPQPILEVVPNGFNKIHPCKIAYPL